MSIYAPRYDCTTCYPIHPPVHAYRHPGRWPPPEPKPILHRPSYPYAQSQLYQTNPAHAQHGHQGEQARQKECNGRRVRFADRLVVIDLPNYPPRNTSATPAPSRNAQRSYPPSRNATATRPPPQVPTANATRAPSRAPTSTGTRPPPSAPPPNTLPTTATRAGRTPPIPTQSRHHGFSFSSSLHELLASFPTGLWDMRRNARPTYHPHYEPRYSEPVFPHHPQKRSIKLYFLPCGRTEFSWITKVRADCRNSLVVNDVLDAISTELFKRSACRDLYEGHPCYSKVRSAHRIRTRRGYTKKPHYDDAFRNVDLYHVDRGQALYFKGLRPERLRDGEVVYLVKFSYA